MKQKSRLTLLAMLVIVVPHAWGNPAQSFIEVMRQLGEAYSQFAQALLSDDFVGMAKAAQAIAEHPRPPVQERRKMMALLGEGVADFKALDANVHKAAAALVQATGSREMSTILARYQELTEGCVACHQRFRGQVRAMRTD